MSNFSIYNHVKLGIVHFKAYPQVVNGTGPIVETLRKIVEDDFWTAVEVGMVKDVKVRNEVRNLLETSHMEVAYASQSKILSNKLNLNSLDKSERRVAIGSLKSAIEEAYHLGATRMRIMSGKDPGADKREEAKDIFADSLTELIEYSNSLGNMYITLKIFDRDIDKCALIGHFSDAADVAEVVSKRVKNFGLLSDLSHFPLLREDPKEALEKVKKYSLDFHIGNCVMRDKLNPMYGDLQPRFGVPGGEIDTPDVQNYFQILKDMKLIGPDKMPVLSAEVRPLLAAESSEVIVTNTKRVIKEAWAAVK
ncbi:MAG: sugar phosphate isomerase/epimerase [Sphaerochaetaceae bacterium]|jgi:sugar phosphate isomerase/epimerase